MAARTIHLTQVTPHWSAFVGRSRARPALPLFLALLSRCGWCMGVYSLRPPTPMWPGHLHLGRLVPPLPALLAHFLSRSFCSWEKWTCTAYLSVLSGACFLPLTSCIIRLCFLFLSSLWRPHGHAPSPSLCLQHNFFTFPRTGAGIAPLLPGVWLLAGACTACQASRA